MIRVPNWDSIVAKERAMRAEPEANILRLFEIAGLDPKTRFRGNDWRYVNFTGLDMRGCDMRGTRLYGAKWKGAQVAGANFEDSDVKYSHLHLAKDWGDAVLTAEQRELFEARAVVHNLVATGRIEEILDKSAVSPKMWVSLIKNSLTFKEAHGHYKSMANAGLGQNKFALTTLLNKAQLSSELEIVRNYLHKSAVLIDNYTVTTLISKSNSEAEAREIYNFYKDDIEPTQYLFNALISKVEFFEHAADIISDMQATGFGFDKMTLNPFISRAVNYNAAKRFFDKLENPRIEDLNSLLKHAKWDQYFKGEREVLGLLKCGPPPTTWTFNTIIGTCDLYSDGRSVLKLMIETGCQPDIYTALALLALVPSGEDAGPAIVIDLLAELITKYGLLEVLEWPHVVSHFVRIIGNKQPALAIKARADNGGLDCNSAMMELVEEYGYFAARREFKAAVDAATSSGQI